MKGKRDSKSGNKKGRGEGKGERHAIKSKREELREKEE